MGNPSSGSKVQTTMSLPKGRHRPSLSAGASLQVEKLAQIEKLSSNEKLPSGTSSPRTTEEQYIAAFLGEKKLKRRTQSSLRGSEDFSKGLELNGVAFGAEERKPLSSMSFRGHRRVGSGNVTPKAAESPRAKGMCTTAGVENAKIAASLFYSPTKLERSMSLSRVAHRVIPDAGGNPRSRSVVSEVVPNKQDTVADLKWQDSQRALESRLQGVVAHRSENWTGRCSCSGLAEKKVDGDNANIEQSGVWPSPHTGSGTLPSVKGALPFPHFNDENLHPDTRVVPIRSIENPSHDLMVPGTVDSRPNYEHMYFNAAYMPGKDIHPVCFETNNLHTEQAATVLTKADRDLHGTASSCLLPNVTSSQRPCSTKGSKPYESDAGCEPLRYELESENLSNTHLENSDRSYHPDILSTSNSSPVSAKKHSSVNLEGHTASNATSSMKHSLVDLSHQDTKEIVLPRTSTAKVTEAELTEAAVLSSLVCENLPGDSLLTSKECKQVVSDVGHGKDVEEISCSRVGLRKNNGPDLSLRKSTSFEPGLEERARIDLEKRTKLRKRRRSVSASGIGAMLLKVVRVSDARPLETLPMTEHRASDAGPMQSTGQSPLPATSSHQDGQVRTERNNIETVGMDVEFEECSTQLVAPDTDACRKEDVGDTSGSKDTKQPLTVELELVGDTLLCKKKNNTEGGQSDSVLHASQDKDQIADSGSRNLNYNEHEKGAISSETTVTCNFRPEITADDPNEEPLLDERFLDAKDKVQDCDSHHREANSRSGRAGTCQSQTAQNQENLPENARLNGSRVNIKEDLGGSRRRRPGSRGRISLDLDSSTEWQSKKLVDIDEEKTGTEHAQANTYHNTKQPLSLLDETTCMMTSQERPRSFTSLLQVSPQQPVDDHRLGPSSIFILANPSFSSSQQDRLWEEQAEAYSSGGRGTPGREDDAAAGNVYLHSPSPGGTISSDDHVHSTVASLRKSQERDLSARSCSGFVIDNGRSHDRRKLSQGRKRGRPRTPLRTLLAEDLNSKTPAGGFLQQLMSRIKGSSSSSKSSSPKSSEAMPKRRHSAIWSGCLCFSYVK